ncbi:phosphatidylinositol 3-kinase catalytic subunit type 3-like [Patiria miniata]|uniref:Phosphatidylinositol 3-kinase catalytic subunit type 3 n=1 Tax=Patiria miniata TaxID=46514 RepID=A0A914BTP0_PATMI|nr:phosphatidylinositol 3-kinase catalytic subunit type 3-like [Patiria miniata]
MADELDRFYYVYSCDLSVSVQIKVGTLEGKRDRLSYKSLIDDPHLRFSGLYEDRCSDLYVTCQIFADGKPLTLPTSTSYKAFSTRWNWNEWLTLPVKYNDLPRTAMFVFTIWDVYGPRKALKVGGTAVSLFGKHGTFRQGMHDLKVWPGVEGDGSVSTSTPGKSDDGREQMSSLSKLTKKHHKGHMLKVDWLDRLTFREIEMINEREKRDSNFMYLMIEFPKVHYNGTHDFSIVHYDKDAEEKVTIKNYADIVTVPDPEMLMENLVEAKHHTLARSERSCLTDKDLKPNASTRDQLNSIVAYNPTKVLSSEEADLVWKFRFYLTNQKPALTKFLKCVNWDVPHEARQAIELLRKWNPIDVADALELLSPQFKNPTVRKYAVSRLKQADDEELLLYLLQLVQALKYENFEDIKNSQAPSTSQTTHTGYTETAVQRESLKSMLPHPLAEIPDIPSSVTVQPATLSPDVPSRNKEEEMDLATFLIDRACHNYSLANYLYWYLLVESDDQETVDARVTQMYQVVLKRFNASLIKEGNDGLKYRTLLIRQHGLTNQILKLMKQVSRESSNRKKKIERLQFLLSDPESTSFNFVAFDPLPLPLHPEIKVNGIVARKASIFKSALTPSKLTFKTVDGAEEYTMICKSGDDLRQDQLILQMITLMDKLLRQENLDLKLTPYRVLATSSKSGMIQFVESIPVADVLSNEGNIQNFFRKHSPNETALYGISQDVMDTYVKSCAGYCVITYLLGVGDRHLDNLLLSKNGKLFHVDFGYILGRDPKPLPPPMKLSKEMVEGMGGASSEPYQDFRKLCYTAFLHLRRHSNLILNLFSLMVDANVPDIALEPDKTVKKLQDKFRLDLTDEEAVQYMQNLIDVSVGAVFAAVVEQIHKFAQYWRR